MKYCPICGNQCEDNAKFCMNCGNSFEEEEKISQGCTVQNIEQNSSLVNQDTGTVSQSQSDKPSEKKGIRIFKNIISYTVFVLLALISIGAFGDGGKISGVLSLLAAVLCIPVIRKSINKVINIKWYAYMVIIFIITLIALILLPTDEEDTPSEVNSNSDSASENKIITELTAENITEAVIIQSSSTELSTITTITDETFATTIINETHTESQNIDNDARYINIMGTEYCFEDLNISKIKEILPNLEDDGEGTGFIDMQNGIMVSNVSGENVFGFHFAHDNCKIYKGVYAGMPLSDIKAKLGDADLDDDDGWLVWYYDKNGNDTTENDAAYILMVYFEGEESLMVSIGHVGFNLT